MKRLGAVLGLATVVLFVPIGLTLTVGGPFVPHLDLAHLGEALRGSYLPVDPILRGIGLVCWLLWGYLVVILLLRGVGTALAGRYRFGGPLLSVSSVMAPPLVRKLIDLALGSTFVISSIGLPPSHASRLPASPVVAQSFIPSSHLDIPGNGSVAQHAYVVQPGDSLWEIAERELGSGYWWREIFELNRGRRFPDGRTLSDPRLIHPGWRLDLPSPQPTPPPADPALSTPRSSVKEPSLSAPVPVSPLPFGEEEPVTAPDQGQRPVVELPSGGVIAASFAAGMLAAQGLASIRRRRSRKALDATSDVEEPALLLDLRRAVRAPAGGHLEAAASEVASLWAEHHRLLPRIVAAIEEADRAILYIENPGTERRGRLPLSTPRVVFTEAGEVVQAEVRRPFPPKLVRADPLESGLLVPLGATRDGRAVHLGLLGVGGIGITGAGASRLASQMIIGCAAGTSCDDLAIYLLGDLGAFEACRSLHHVRAAGDWKDASPIFRQIQAELLARSRLFLEEGVEDLSAHWAAHRDEMLHGILIAATEPPAAMAGVIESVVSQASRLGGVCIGIGWQPPTATLAVSADSHVEIRSDLADVPRKLRPFEMSPDDLAEAAAIVNAARPPAQDFETEEKPGPATKEEPSESERVSFKPDTPRFESNGFSSSEVPIENQEPVVISPDLPLLAEPPEAAMVVRCLGNFQLARDNRVVQKGLRTTSRELLALLAANRAGVPTDRILDYLWPDKDADAANKELHNALYHLRQRASYGREPTKMVERVGETYRLNPQHWWVDVWAFESLVSQSEETAAETSIKLLSEGLHLYRGPVCDDCYFAWLEPVRTRYRALFVRASARLANFLTEFGEPDDALAVLDRAIEVDPVNEDLYRRAIAIEGGLGRRKAVHLRFRRLQAILEDEVDADPEDETLELMRKVLSGLERTRRATEEGYSGK